MHTTRQLRAAADGRVEARAGVRYPADWSSKGGVDQLPHLSTVDVLVLGAHLAELAIARSQGLSPDRRGAMWLRGVRIRAGRLPLEEGLDDFAVSAAVRGTTAAGAVIPGFLVSTVDGAVGPLRITCVIEHPETDAADPDSRFSGPGHFGSRVAVRDVEVDCDAARATATAAVTAGPGVSMIDCFVTGLQLGQILLYELDSVDRAHSQTLWMRQTTWAIASPAPARPGPVAVTAALENIRLLERSPQDIWRSADIVTDMAGLSLRCSVAHRLAAG